MELLISDNFDFEALKDTTWQGGYDTLKRVEQENLQYELMELLSMVFDEQRPSLTIVNDWLWFERPFIMQELGFDW